MECTEQEVYALAMVTKEVRARFTSFSDLAHGWEHVQRVYHLALRLAEQEGANAFIVGMAALMHDVGRTTRDPTRSHAERSAALATELMTSLEVPLESHDAIIHAILAHSYRRGISPATLEARVLFDADRLDNMGASGVMRWAMTTKRKRWPEMQTYHPDDPFATERPLDTDHYLLDRFLAKQARLSDALTTTAGRAMAERRVAFVQLYLQELTFELAEAGSGQDC